MHSKVKKEQSDYISFLEKKLKETDDLNKQLNEYIENVQLAQMEAIEAQKVADAANKAKSDFLANMSHELRTPMNGVMGMSHLLMDTELDLEQKEFVETINNSAQTLLILLNDILDFSKIEAGELILENIVYDVKKSIQHAINLLLPLAEAKGINLISVYDDNIPQKIHGDPERLKQIITNLVSNAIKFTDHGHIKINVSVSNGYRLVCKVEDTGIGIPQDKLNDVFGKFTQADASITRKYGGTGLGLAITKQLIELMSGYIGLESELGKGSTFWFELPIEEAKEDTADITQQKIEVEKNRVKVSDARILIVEDYPVNQVFAKKLLAKFGFTNIDLAENGLEALEYVKANEYDVIFMDCQMPEMDGFQATREIRSWEKDLNDQRLIIAMTANAMVGDKERCLEAGMSEYISKPLNPEKLKNMLSRWIDFEEFENVTFGKVKKVNSDKESVPPVNLSQLRMFTDDDPEEERELIEMFFDQAGESISHLEDSYTSSNILEWKSAAHKLKGASGNLGADNLHKLCLNAEKNFEQSNDNKSKMLDSIKLELETVKVYLFNEINKVA